MQGRKHIEFLSFRNLSFSYGSEGRTALWYIGIGVPSSIFQTNDGLANGTVNLTCVVSKKVSLRIIVDCMMYFASTLPSNSMQASMPPFE
jgi:hypothetical protein